MTRDDDRTPLDQVVDRAANLFVYAPIGLFFEGPSLLPKLAEQGRVHARNARLFGEFAVRQGEAELKRRVESLEEQAGALFRLMGLGDEPDVDSEPAPRPAAVEVPPARAASNGSATVATSDGEVATGPPVTELAITDYDSLSASQVVTRLAGLTIDELEAVRSYEATHRGRKTILNKVAQLQA